jgi:hypothetical protein
MPSPPRQYKTAGSTLLRLSSAKKYERLFHETHSILFRNENEIIKTEKPQTPTNSSSPLRDPDAWQIVWKFACGEMSTLEEAEDRLRACPGERYSFEEWKKGFDAVFKAENDATAAIAAVNALKQEMKAENDAPAMTTSSSNQPSLSQLDQLEGDLTSAVDELAQRRRIHGTRLTLEELLNPIEEKDVGWSEYQFLNGDQNIVAEARRQIGMQEERDNSEESSGDEADGEDAKAVSPQEGMALCEQLEQLCVTYPDVKEVDILQLQRQLRKLCGHLNHLDFHSKQQTTLDQFLSS